MGLRTKHYRSLAAVHDIVCSTNRELTVNRRMTFPRLCWPYAMSPCDRPIIDFLDGWFWV